MTEQPRRRLPHQATVVARREISPHLLRLTLHCPDLASGELEPHPASDAYIKLELSDPDGNTVLRTYTVHTWRPESGELDLDIVAHADGVAGPWVRSVEAGTPVTFRGPGGGYSPTEDATVAHLFFGDLSALPAIEASLLRVPADHHGQVVIAVEGEADVRELVTHLPVEWVVADTLPEALERAAAFVEAWPCQGDLEVFLHGEAGTVRRLRRHVRVDRHVPAARQSISGYWRLGTTDEGWRQQKAEWRAPIDEAEAAATES